MGSHLTKFRIQSFAASPTRSARSLPIFTFPIAKPHYAALVSATLLTFHPVTIPPGKYEPEPPHRSHLWRRRRRQRGGNTPQDFTKEVNR